MGLHPLGRQDLCSLEIKSSCDSPRAQNIPWMAQSPSLLEVGQWCVVYSPTPAHPPKPTNFPTFPRQFHMVLGVAQLPKGRFTGVGTPVMRLQEGVIHGWMGLFQALWHAHTSVFNPVITSFNPNNQTNWTWMEWFLSSVGVQTGVNSHLCASPWEKEYRAFGAFSASPLLLSYIPNPNINIV